MDVGPLGAALYGEAFGGGVHGDLAHGREINDEASLRRGGTSRGVAAATDREIEGMGGGVGEELGDRGSGFWNEHSALNGKGERD